MNNKKKLIIVGTTAVALTGTGALGVGLYYGLNNQNNSNTNSVNWNELSSTFSYPNATNTFVEDVNESLIQSQVIKPQSLNVKIINLQITKRNYQNGAIEIKYQYNNTKDGSNLLSPKMYTSVITGFLKGTKFEYINHKRQLLEKLSLSAYYPNKSSINAQDSLIDRVSLSVDNNVSLDNLPNLTLNKEAIAISNDGTSIDVIVLLSYFDTFLNRTISSEQIVSIKGFKSSVPFSIENNNQNNETNENNDNNSNQNDLQSPDTNNQNVNDNDSQNNNSQNDSSPRDPEVQENQNNNQDQSQLRAQYLAKLNSMNANASIKNADILASALTQNNFASHIDLTIENNSENIKIVNLEIANKNDLNGEVEFSYQLQGHFNDEVITSEVKRKQVNGFKTELDRLNELTVDYVQYLPNKEETLPSEAILDNVAISSNTQELLAKAVEVQVVNVDNENGNLTISFKLQSQRANLNNIVSTKVFNATISDFNSYIKLRTKEKQRLNELIATNLYASYFNVLPTDKAQTLPSEITDNQIKINNLNDSNEVIVVIEQVTDKNNQNGTVLLTYKIQSAKTQPYYQNIVSDNVAQGVISGFLTIQQARENELARLNQLKNNLSFDYPNKEETLTTDAVESNIQTVNLDDNTQIIDLNITNRNSETHSITFEYKLKSLNSRFKENNLITDTFTGTIEGFKVNPQAQLLEYVNENYILEPKAELTNHPNVHLLATSINANNLNYYFNVPELENVNIQINDFVLDKNNPTKLTLNYTATRDGVSVNTSVDLNFENSFAPLIDKIGYTHLEQLYDIDYYSLYQYSLKQIQQNKEIQNQIFKPKFKKLERFFDYQIDFNTLETQNRIVKRAYRDAFGDNAEYNYTLPNIRANIKVLLQDNEVKTLNLTQDISNNNVSAQNQTRAYVDEQPYSFKDSYTQTQYYTNPFGTKLIDLIKQEAQTLKAQEGIPDQDVNLLINVFESYKNNIQPPVRLEAKRRILTTIINKYIQFDNFAQIAVEPFNEPNTYEYLANKNVLRFKVSGTNTTTNQKETFNFVWRTTNYENDPQVNKLVSIIKANNIGAIFENSQVKNSNKTHSDILASQAWNEFENIYELPSYNEYRIGLVPVANRTAEDLKHNDIDAWANLKFGLYKNDQLVSPTLVTSALRLNYFKYPNKDDYKPLSGEWFTAEDFQGSQFTQPSQAIKDKIAQINGSDFEYNYAQGNLKVVDPFKIIEQKAFDKLNYLFKFTGASNASENTGDFGSFNNGDTSEENVTPANPTKIYEGEITSEVNVNELANNYYIYYFNVQPDSRTNRFRNDNLPIRRSRMSFALGFINKRNPNERWSTIAAGNPLITLINLKNDYVDQIAPEAALNSITPSDIVKEYSPIGNGTKIGTLTATEFKDRINSTNTTVPKPLDYLTIRDNLIYDDTLFRKDYVIVSEVKLPNDQEGSAYVRFKYQVKEQNASFQTVVVREIEGSTWYKITGFRIPTGSRSKDTSSDNVILSNLSSYYGLTKVFLGDGENPSVLRNRYIEMNYKDVQIKKDENNRKMSWLFKKDYYESQLNRDGIVNPIIKFHFAANTVVIDAERYNRIFKINEGLNFDINYEDLKRDGSITLNQRTNGIYSSNNGTIEIPYKAIFTLTEQGIEFNFELTDTKNYQIIDKNEDSILYNPLRQPGEADKHWQEFHPEKAMFFDKNGARVEIQYQNKVANEVFGDKKTNVYNYKNMDYTPENQPIILYNETYEDQDLFKYNPNQMIKWKWHEGYKLSNTFMNLKYSHPKVQEVMGRTFALNRGSATMLGKVNNNPNDGRFYAITNNHVVSMNDVPNPTANVQVNGTTLTRAGYEVGNNVDRGHGYWRGLYVDSTKIIPVWTGHNQINNNGGDAQFLDITVFIVDVNPIIDNAIKSGRMQTALWYKNWFNLPNLNFTSITKDYQWGTLAKNGSYTTGEIFNGWPYGKQGGYIINRSSKGSVNESFSRRDGYLTPIYFNAGNSGTGVLDNEGNYIAAINSGRPQSALVSWYGLRPDVNYFGLIEDNQNIWDLANKNSLALNIMKFNAYDPTIDIPWWIKNKQNDN
ncbi:MGA_1079 family surface serine endopeptidase [Mycoplasmopsis columboralis]|uniref:Lipoprotein-associated type-17 domain-containing protein n=1 Tax=Mycoplasmopsis columboralis TaxID=171282 RepID=A0A449B5W3_9BACT|nr:lipoprotein 17-related variable surface protein [Mycoplasmopsis columboralis]VEU75994.1 Uncharacterised protein [Mycoplasmopsis columboralis]